MLQFFDTLTDTSGNALQGATVAVTAYPGGGAVTIYSSNGTTQPIANSTVTADVTGQVSFFAPDGAYILTYSYKSTVYKTRSPVQFLDPMGFVAATDTGGSANNYAVTGSQYPAQKYVGLKLELTAAHTNNGASTLVFQGDAGFAINQPGGTALAPGMLQSSGLARVEWDGTQWQLIGSQSQPFYAQTTAEANAGVVPVNTSYLPGSLRRYGADPTAVADSSTALLNAIKCNSDIFDDYPGGGTYLFNSQVSTSNIPFTLRGQARWPYTTSGFINGTKFILGNAAGIGAALLKLVSGVYGLRIQNIGFACQTATLGQYFIRASGDLRYTIIEGCAFLGIQGVGNNLVAIQCDSASVYTGGVVIRDNVFDQCNTGIWLKGACTTVKITNNEMYGYSTAAATAAGNGIEMDSPVSGSPVLMGNYLEGWTNGIYCNGATAVVQIANIFAVCTNSFNWTGSSNVKNVSVGELLLSGAGAPVYSQADGAGNTVIAGAGTFFGSAQLQLTRNIAEGTAASGGSLRTFALGYPQTVTYAAGNFTASTGTWTPSSGQQATYAWSINGKTLTVWFSITGGAVSGTPTWVGIAIPNSYTAAAGVTNGCAVANNGTFSASSCQVNASGSVIQVFANVAGSATFATSAVAEGMISFPVN